MKSLFHLQLLNSAMNTEDLTTIAMKVKQHSVLPLITAHHSEVSTFAHYSKHLLTTLKCEHLLTTMKSKHLRPKQRYICILNSISYLFQRMKEIFRQIEHIVMTTIFDLSWWIKKLKPCITKFYCKNIFKHGFMIK